MAVPVWELISDIIAPTTGGPRPDVDGASDYLTGTVSITRMDFPPLHVDGSITHGALSGGNSHPTAKVEEISGVVQ